MANDKLNAVVSCQASEGVWGSRMSLELNLNVPAGASEAEVKAAVREVLRTSENIFRSDVREEHPNAAVSCVAQVSKDPITHPTQALSPQDVAAQRQAFRERRLNEVMRQLDGASSPEDAAAILKKILAE